MKVMKISSYLGRLTKRLGNIRKAQDRTTPIVDFVEQKENKKPLFSTLPSVAVTKKMWTREPAIRGAVRAKVNATIAPGYSVKTLKVADEEKKDPDARRIAEVTKDLTDPKNRFISTIRQGLYNLTVFDNMIFETKRRSGAGFIWALDFEHCTLVPSADKTEIVACEYKLPGMAKPKVLNKDEFVYISMENFGSGIYGISLLEALKAASNLLDFARQWNTRQFTTGGIPQLAFILKSGTPEDRRLLKSHVKQTNIGNHYILQGEITIDKINSQIKEGEYQKLSAQQVQAVMTAMQVPAVMMALPSGSQGETDRQAMNAFASEIQAIQQILETALAEAILNVYGPQYKDIYVKFKPWVDARQLAAVLKNYSTIGSMTINEVRERLDLAPVPYGGVPYVQNFLGEILGEKDWNAGMEFEDQNSQGNDGNENPSGQNREDDKSWDLFKASCKRREGESIKDCMARKIPANIDEGMEQDQAVKVARSQCDCQPGKSIEELQEELDEIEDLE